MNERIENGFQHEESLKQSQMQTNVETASIKVKLSDISQGVSHELSGFFTQLIEAKDQQIAALQQQLKDNDAKWLQ
jgi:predicted RNase H-like nuclease (RuvC/YqgF family)